MTTNQATTNFNKTMTVPKCFLQGNLFPVARKAQTEAVEQTVSLINGKTFTAKHLGLSQFDLAVTFALKKLVNSRGDNQGSSFSIASIVNAMQRKEGGKTRGYIIDALKRSNFLLDFSNVEQDGFKGYIYNELSQGSNNQYNITINQSFLTQFFDDNEVCEINIDAYLGLQPGLQSWLYGFIASMPELKCIDVDKLHELSGSSYNNKNDFKKAVKKILNALYQKKLIEWHHGITRQGLVFWELTQQQQEEVATIKQEKRHPYSNTTSRLYAAAR